MEIILYLCTEIQYNIKVLLNWGYYCICIPKYSLILRCSLNGDTIVYQTNNNTKVFLKWRYYCICIPKYSLILRYSLTGDTIVFVYRNTV